MPNWCSNDLFITARTKAGIEKLKEFKRISNTRQTNEEPLLDMDVFIPYPEKYKEMDEAARKNPKLKGGYNSGGYDWCVKNRGTKWNFCETVLCKETEKKLVYSFDTAWSPPIPVIQKMAERFPELRFKLNYYECGSGFKGTLICEKGKTVKNETLNYKGNRGG